MNLRMRAVRGLLAAALLALAMPSAAATFWTSPDPLVAGQPSRVAFSTWSYGGVPDSEVLVEDQQILIRQTNLCAGDLCLAARIPVVAEAMLPPLQAGSYTVLLEWAGVDEPPDEVATLVVREEPGPRVEPAEGFWSPVGQPGSGLFLQRRGDLLTVSAYSYEFGQTHWRLGTTRYGGDDVLVPMSGYRDGECLGCADYHPAEPAGYPTMVRLRFESARRGWLDILVPGRAASTVAITSLPYGAAYVPQPLTDTVDEAFGPLPLPDLRGDWVFTMTDADAPVAHSYIRLMHREAEDGQVLFDGLYQVVCHSASTDQRAGCAFASNMAITPPPPEPLATFLAGEGWFVPLGNIQEDRMTGALQADGRTWQVQGFRVAPPPHSSD